MNNNMYLYFDSNGYLKEFITCPARAGSENVNSIYFYVEPALESDRNKVDGNGDAYYALPNNVHHGVLTFKLHDVLDGVTDENGVVLNSLAFTSANFRIEDIQPFDKKRDLLFFKWFQKYQFVKVDLTADILLNAGNVECTIGCYNTSNIKVYNLDLFSFYVADSAVQSANYVTTSQYHMLLALMQSGLSGAVMRYNVSSGDTLADIYDLIGTQIVVLNIEGDEYLCEMSGNTNIVIYDIHNQEWYAFTGANSTVIDDVLNDQYKYRVATKEELENFGNLFTYKGTASVSEINALTDIGNGWCYNLTDSGTLTLGNLQVETGDNVAFDGTIWTKLSSETILGQYYTKQEGQEFETQVDNRVDAIENQVQQVASGSPKGVYATLADLQAAYPTGTTGIYVVSANGHWYYWSGSAWTDGGVYQTAVNYDELENNIESLKSSFFKLAISSWEPGIINFDGSILSSLTGWRTSDYIECNTRFLTIKGELNGFSSTGYRYLYCYDKDKKPIRELLLSQATPLVYEDYTNIRLCPNTAYIKVCCGASNIDDFELFVNPKLEIETYNKTYKKYFNIPNDTSYEGYIEVDGSFNSLSGYLTSDFIEVTKNHIYFEGYLSGLAGYNYINCYNEEKNFISGLGTTQVSCDTLTKIDLPSNTRYIRLTGDYYNYAGNLIYNTYDERFKLISPYDNEEPEDKIMDDNFYAFRKFGVIGDSLSVGHMYNEYTQQQVGENLEYSWSYFLARKCGSQAICFGFSGATTKTFWENNRGLLTQEGNKCQCYILCLGVNDRDTIGSLSDIDWSDYNNNQDTYYGRYARIIQYLKEINPLAPVFCFNMPVPYGPIYPNINTAISEIVNNTPLNGVYLVDLTQYNTDFGKVNDTEFFNYHYTPMGYNAIAKINQKALSKVMLDNSEDFRSIAFIPLN